MRYDVARLRSNKKFLFSLLAATILLYALFPSARPFWTVEFNGSKISSSSGDVIDIIVTISAEKKLEGVTATLSIPPGWSITSGPTSYNFGTLESPSQAGWTLRAKANRTTDEIKVILASANPAHSETRTVYVNELLPPGVGIPKKEEPVRCAQVITPAKNPATGECREYATPCDVPEGWLKTDSCAYGYHEENLSEETPRSGINSKALIYALLIVAILVMEGIYYLKTRKRIAKYTI